MTSRLMNAYDRLPVRATRGEGAWLFDEDGNRYLDTMSGIGVTSLGHAHPEIAEALADQARRLVHTANVVGLPLQEELAERLCRISGLDRAFFANSGAEANECALKLARLYGHQRGLSAPEIVVADGAFHGRTLATLSASGSRKVQAGFEPLVHGFVRMPYDDVDALETIAARNDNVVAVMLEPIQGESGVVLPRRDYLREVRRVCDANGWLLMLDEVQSGLCKTGAWYAFQHVDAPPDVLTTAKALGNGVPIGACLARGPAAEVLQPGKHGSTFGGGPLACRAGLTVLDIMQRDDLAKRARELGDDLMQRLRAKLGELEIVREIRGQGLMLGIELTQPLTGMKRAALDHGLLINVARERIIRLLPPLIVDREQIEMMADRLARLIGELARE